MIVFTQQFRSCFGTWFGRIWKTGISRNCLFQVLRDVASYKIRDTVLKLLAMFNSPVSVGLEIVSFLGNLADVYGDQCIECLSLSAVFELDRALQDLELPGRECVFHSLSYCFSKVWFSFRY